MRFQDVSIQPLFMGVGMHMNLYVTTPPQNSGGWAGVPITKFCVCPSLVSRLPTLCKHGGDTKQRRET